MENYLLNRLQEIRHLMDNEDLNRAGIRILDLVYDLNYPKETRGIAQELRKRYNQAKELGKQQINDPKLGLDFRSFVESLPKPGTQILEPKNGLVARAEGISKEFRSRLRVFTLNPISIELNRGTIIGVVGENGNGKTTLLRMIAGELACDHGKVVYYIDGKPSTDWTLNKFHTAFVPQRTEKWFGNVYENLSFMAAIKGIPADENREKTEFMLHRMGLTNFAEHSWAQLSSGYRLRFEIARALVWDPAILLLDEPLANLDLQAQELMLNDLRNLADSLRNPVSIIMSSQQLHEVEAVSDQIIFLKNGRAVFNGTLSDFRNQQTNRTFEINGRFTNEQLLAIFSDWSDIRIENNVSAFLLTCPMTYTQQDILRKLVENNLEIDYLRDITGSTKLLFNDKF
jgi:ABC-2 type transport system ATP-binding protein